MLTFQNEPWALYWAEAKPLWAEHYEEVGAKDCSVEIDEAFYEALERSGQLQITTARENGVLVGYVLMLVRKHPHYRELCGFEDAYFLRKSSRGGKAGLNLIRASLFWAGARGVKKVFFHSKVKKNLRLLFESLEFEHTDEIWSKVL